MYIETLYNPVRAGVKIVVMGIDVARPINLPFATMYGDAREDWPYDAASDASNTLSTTIGLYIRQQSSKLVVA